jgi:hypothetical protein
MTTWTNPRTYTDGELIDDSIMNTHTRNNLLHLYEQSALSLKLLAVQATDQSSSGTSFVASNTLKNTIAADEAWMLLFNVIITHASGDGEVRFTFPSGGSLGAQQVGIGTGGVYVVPISVTGTTPSPVTSWSGSAAGWPHQLWVTYVNGSTAGDVVLEFRGTTGVGIMKARHSTLWGAKVG